MKLGLKMFRNPVLAKKRLVIIGNGMAGARTAEEIIARDGARQFDIVMFGDEPYGNYNRILLSNVLGGNQSAEEIFINGLSWYRKNNITLYAGEKIVRIDRAAKRVYSDQGTVEEYDRLVIATGSRAFVPPARGMTDKRGRLSEGVFAFRTLDDTNRILQEARPGARIAVIGGGLLGLEAARGLLGHGCEVHVVHLSAHIMNAQLDAPASLMLRKTMQDLGVQIHLEKLTTEVLKKDGQITGLAFRDGTTLDCDLIVISAGIKPNSEIGIQCGLSVERGIVVDDFMRSPDDPNIYIVGECAQHRGQIYGLVAPLYEQAKVLADQLTGRNPASRYKGSRPSTKLKVMGVELASMGRIEPDNDTDEVVQFCEPRKGRYKKLVIRDGRLIGAIMMGDLHRVAYLSQAFEQNAPLPEERLSLLFDIGAPDNSVSFEGMPDSAQICNCNGVTKEDIGICVSEGARSAKAVMSASRAGMGCGSCKKMVGDLVSFYCGGDTEEDPSIHYYVPGVPMKKPELVETIRARGLKSVSAVFSELAGGRVDPESKPGLASLLMVIWKDQYEDERGARFINDRVHGNIQKDGTFSVIPEMPGGLTNPDQLRRIADVAEKYDIPLVKLTGGQRIDLLGIPKEQLPAVWNDLGMPAGWAWGKSYRTCKSCVGSEFCRFGLGDSMALAEKIEARFRGLDSPGKLKLATAGCPRNCSEAYVKDVGAVAVGEGKWEIYIGGGAGAHIRKGDLLYTADSEDEALLYAGRFIQYYRENAKWKERTYAFVERMGVEYIRDVVVNDSLGIAGTLDAALQASVDAVTETKDPWKEGRTPRTANQFVEIVQSEQ